MKTFFVIISMVFSFMAQASSYGYSSGGDGGWRLGWSLMRDDHTTNYNAASATDTQINHTSTKIGYVWPSGFYLGGLYESSSSFFNATGNPSPEVRISYGPSIGYYNSGFFGAASYLTNTTDTQSNGSYFSGGSGYEIELGYEYNLATNFYIGISLIYNTYTWNQLTAGGLNVSQNNSQSDTYPALGLGFTF